MRVSELVDRSGVPLATIKYYLREGLLMPGEPTSATQSSYDDGHLRRLALIRALTDVVGLSVQKAGDVIRLIDHPLDDLVATLGLAVEALPPYSDRANGAEGADAAAPEFPRARRALLRLGQIYDPRYAAVAQLEQALEAAESVGLALSDERLEQYGQSIMQIARLDIELVPDDDPAAAVEYSVLGTAIYEPVIAAMRRLAHQDVVARRLGTARTG